jgi:hypothetical protein
MNSHVDRSSLTGPFASRLGEPLGAAEGMLRPAAPGKNVRIAIAIATVGRPEVLAQVAPHWLGQTRAPDVVLIAAVTPADIGDLPSKFPAITCLMAPKGLPAQRNAALTALRQHADVVVFFDDDFVPSRTFLACLETLLARHPDLAIITGELLADGIIGPGISYDDAAAMVAAHDAQDLAPDFSIKSVRNAYGCNMVTHVRLGPDVRFDEHLPLYAWLEDVDYSAAMRAHGGVVKCAALTGVHMGVKVGRQPGRRMGYSQIANVAYLVTKGTVSIQDALVIAGRNIAMNALRSFAPEPWMDRRGRLQGNLLGLWDLVRGKANPRRMLDL